MVHAPELLILYALDMFLVLSIVTVLFDSSFPLAVPYFFQLLSIAGTGHMYVGQIFDEMFSLESRFWYSFFYLDAMILSAFAISAYLLYVKKSYAKGLMFTGGFSIPITGFGIYLMTFYDNYQTTPIILRFYNGYTLLLLLVFAFFVAVFGVLLFVEGIPKLSLFDLKSVVRSFIEVYNTQVNQVQSQMNLVNDKPSRYVTVIKRESENEILEENEPNLEEILEDFEADKDTRHWNEEESEKKGLVEEEFYWGNSNQKIFHKQSCHLVEMIKQENRKILFSDIEALDAGYRECRICKP